MTIVASNSLTVSNVYDGTITHTAYANSADGTDGFTTVYPNLNLLKNTIITQESLTPKNWSASVGSLLSVGSNNGIKVVNNGGIIGSTGGFGYGNGGHGQGSQRGQWKGPGRWEHMKTNQA